MLFQALGSQYTYTQAWKHFFTVGSISDVDDLKAYLGYRYDGKAELYRKGRSALSEAIRISTGGEGKVIINGFTCISVVQAVEAAGCTPVYVDITKRDLNFDTGLLEAVCKKEGDIRGIVVQNPMGMPCDITAVRKITDKYKIALIEDLAHSAGANYEDGSEVGTVGDVVMMSFGRDKAIDVASGGALIVRKASLMGKIKHPKTRVRWFDSFRDRLYPLMMWHVRATYKVGLGKAILFLAYSLKLAVKSADGEVKVDEKLPNWQAKRTLGELARLENRRTIRLSNTMSYAHKLSDSLVVEASLAQGSVPVRFPILVADRAKLLDRFNQAGLYLHDTWYDTPVAPKRFYGAVDYPEADCPVSVEVAKTIVNLPTHEDVELAHIDQIVKIVKEVTK